MKYHVNDYAQAAYSIFQKTPRRHTFIMQKLWQLLIKNRQTKQLGSIIHAMRLRAAQDSQLMTIETPLALSWRIQRQIVQIYTHTTGQKVIHVHQITSKNSLGGIRGKTTTHTFDWTIETMMHQLETL